MLTGSAGTGKSTICHELRQRLQAGYRVVLLTDAGCSTRRALLQSILFELDLPYVGLTEQESRLNLLAAIEHEQPGRPLVLIVEDAGRLNVRLLEELRTLSSCTRDGVPAVRLLLSGGLDLDERLAIPELASVTQRITCHQVLGPVTQAESARIIDERIQQAGGDGWEHVFNREAMELVCHVSDGNLRGLMELAEYSLKLASKRREVPVTAESVRNALDRLRHLPMHWNEPARRESALPSPPSPDVDSDVEPSDPNTTDLLRLEEQAAPASWDALESLATGLVASFEVGAGMSDAEPVDDPRDIDELAAGQDPLESLFVRGGTAHETARSAADLDAAESPHDSTNDDDDSAEVEPAFIEFGAGMTDEQHSIHPRDQAHAPAGRQCEVAGWDEIEVEDHYAELDDAQGSLLEEEVPAVSADLHWRACAEEMSDDDSEEFDDELEDELLEQIRGLQAEVSHALLGGSYDEDGDRATAARPAELETAEPKADRPDSQAIKATEPSTDDEPELTATEDDMDVEEPDQPDEVRPAAPATLKLGLSPLPEWDVIQPDWISVDDSSLFVRPRLPDGLTSDSEPTQCRGCVAVEDHAVVESSVSSLDPEEQGHSANDDNPAEAEVVGASAAEASSVGTAAPLDECDQPCSTTTREDQPLAVEQPRRRPYARLFSMLRRRQSGSVAALNGEHD
ncbi:MAG: ATP-binding protein [Planctomycetaceae bacterium]